MHGRGEAGKERPGKRRGRPPECPSMIVRPPSPSMAAIASEPRGSPPRPAISRLTARRCGSAALAYCAWAPTHLGRVARLAGRPPSCFPSFCEAPHRVARQEARELSLWPHRRACEAIRRVRASARRTRSEPTRARHATRRKRACDWRRARRRWKKLVDKGGARGPRDERCREPRDRSGLHATGDLAGRALR